MSAETTETTTPDEAVVNCGPIYNVPLLDTLPIGGMLQALPSKADLVRTQKAPCGHRVVAGYETVLVHYQGLRQAVEDGGFDLSACGCCGATVICIPDGLPMCRKCAKGNE